MRGKSTLWWVASVLGAAILVTAAAGRARADENDSAYTAGEVVGGVIGPVLIVGLIAWAIVRYGGANAYWAVPAVLVVAGLLNVAIRLVQTGGEAASKTGCEDATFLTAAAIAPGAPYRVAALKADQLAEIEAQLPLEAAEPDATQIIDTRDQAAFLLTTLTSTGEVLTEDNVFAGFESGAGDAEPADVGGHRGRIARPPGRVALVTTVGDCSIVSLTGIEERPTRALAAALQLP